jgi:hypothetical protein
MILDNSRFIGQSGSDGSCKLLIDKLAPVAQWIERLPPKLPAERWQVAARASNTAVPLSNKTVPACAKPRRLARVPIRILDSY